MVPMSISFYGKEWGRSPTHETNGHAAGYAGGVRLVGITPVVNVGAVAISS